MTLRHLREELKATYELVKHSYSSTQTDNANMREFWIDVAAFLNTRAVQDGIAIVHESIINFHRAGELYYHAKKHGLQSAMLLKLSRP